MPQLPRTDAHAKRPLAAGQPHGRERIAHALERDATLPPGMAADTATSAVMSVLARRLTHGEVHVLLEALPPDLHELFVRAVIERGRDTVLKLDRAEAVAHVADALGVTPARAESIAAAVLSVMSAEVPWDVARDVARQLPRDLSALWLASSPIAPPAIPGGGGDSARPAIEAAIERRVSLPAHVTATAAFTAVMDLFSQRLSGGEAFDVLLGLPDDLRRLTEGSVLSRDEHASVFDCDTLIGAVAHRLRVARHDAEAIAAAVLATVKEVLPVKENRRRRRPAPARPARAVAHGNVSQGDGSNGRESLALACPFRSHPFREGATPTVAIRVVALVTLTTCPPRSRSTPASSASHRRRTRGRYASGSAPRPTEARNAPVPPDSCARRVTFRSLVLHARILSLPSTARLPYREPMDRPAQ